MNDNIYEKNLIMLYWHLERLSEKHFENSYNAQKRVEQEYYSGRAFAYDTAADLLLAYFPGLEEKI